MNEPIPWTEAEYEAAVRAARELGTNSPGPLNRPVPTFKAARRDGSIVLVDARTFDPATMERLP